MIFHPPILALIVASLLTSGFTVWAAVFAVRLLSAWDLSSGSEAQLRLERQTYLVSTVVAFALAVEAASLVLFVFNADRMATLFTGAMCAVGTLNASVYGFPTLLAKIAVFFASSVWLVVNRADGKGHDYPFTRLKYVMLLGLAPLVLLAAGLQLAYFLDLKADTITSCCGKMFAPERPSITGEMAGMSEGSALWLLFGVLVVTLGMAVLAVGVLHRQGQGDTGSMWRRSALAAYGVVSAGLFVVAIAGVVSVLSLYVYEHPHHHCPFCLLKREYGYFGFLLYAPLFLGTALGLAAGVLGAFQTPDSLSAQMPVFLRRLVIFSAMGFEAFGMLALWIIWSSRLILFG